MNLLIKYPSRGRPERFFQGLDSIVNNIAQDGLYHVSCTLDLDDDSMNNKSVIDRINSYKNVSIQWGLSESKIHAINRDLPLEFWDIVLCQSDDFRFTFWGFDEIIRQEFKDGDTDKLIHIPDQQAKDALATMYIAGRKFYERFGFIYDPKFKSLWCDNLVQDVAKYLGKYRYINCPGVIEHLNPGYGGYERDAMFDHQQSFWDEDEKTYREIKRVGLHNYLSDYERRK